MNDDNTQGGAEPSPASAGSHNTDMAAARLSATNTWLQEEIARLRLTDAERESLRFCIRASLPETEKLGGVAGELCRMHRDRLRGLLERLG